MGLFKHFIQSIGLTTLNNLSTDMGRIAKLCAILGGGVILSLSQLEHRIQNEAHRKYNKENSPLHILCQ